jgi:BON domain-containing protein
MAARVDRANGRTLGDAELEEAARDALVRYGTLRIWGHAQQITARNGVVTLEGHVRTIPSKVLAERLIRQVPGVRELVNNLFVDTDLEVAAAQALAHDPRTVDNFPGILVGCAFGEILLKGSVGTQETKKAAGEIVAQVPGVREVTNELVAPEPPKPATPPKPAPKPTPKPAPTPPKAASGVESATQPGVGAGSEGKPADEEGESSEE